MGSWRLSRVGTLEAYVLKSFIFRMKICKKNRYFPLSLTFLALLFYFPAFFQSRVHTTFRFIEPSDWFQSAYKYLLNKQKWIGGSRFLPLCIQASCLTVSVSTKKKWNHWRMWHIGTLNGQLGKFRSLTCPYLEISMVVWRKVK